MTTTDRFDNDERRDAGRPPMPGGSLLGATLAGEERVRAHRASPLEGPRHMFGWRFQATDEAGEAFVFDVYRDEMDWHVHHVYR